MPTEKLYQHNCYTQSFEAAILRVIELPNNHFGLVLDKTLFYPESGGQPFDTGSINGLPVLAVHDEAGELIHIMGQRPEGNSARGEINWQRRFDHMQQHSGEHILSAAFQDLLGAKNVGFHIGPTFSTIDLDIFTLSQAQASQVEEFANAVVFANRPISSRLVDKSNLAQLVLRKPVSKDYSKIRLVEISGCDLCPCGGTHVALTGEIGLIKIRSWERKKNGVRIDFVCGGRALGDYQLKNSIASEVSTLLSSPVEDLTAACEKQAVRMQSLSREIALLKRERNRLLAESLFNKAEDISGIKLITLIEDNLSPLDLNALAVCLTGKYPVVSLLAGVEPEQGRAHLVFSRSPGVNVNMHELLKQALAVLDGRGGGKPETAQGGCRQTAELPAAFDAAAQKIKGLLLEA
ncbi:MAG TPA: DHHA1 domain-containing protein [Verrucomicrobiae bacterium]|nr:DHHA1 domain-containing protein [Verrucomicrobiae bacterium]